MNVNKYIRAEWKIDIENIKLINFIIKIYCYFNQLKIKIDN